MAEDNPASAQGELGRTPFAHLLVYALERRLTGALFITFPALAPDGAPADGTTTDVIRLARGAPVKIRPGDGYAKLGGMLVEAGAISRDTLREALATKGLLGDVLLVAGRVDRIQLEHIADQQFIRRIVRLFACPPEATFEYRDGDSELGDYGGDPAGVDPLALLWRGLKEHAEVSTMIDGTLARIGDAPLELHANAVVRRFGFDDSARRVVDAIRHGSVSYDELLASGVAAPELVRSVVYALAITRQFDFGTGSKPVGAEEARGAVGTTTLARLRLRSALHRHGAAAPDPPGTGERDLGRLRTSPSTVPPPRSGERPSIPGNDELPISADGQTSALGPGSGALTPSTAPEAPESIAEVPQVPELLAMARECLDANDLESALQACTLARELAPRDEEAATMSVWIRALRPEADLQELLLEFDEVLMQHAASVAARYYRAVVRRHLGDFAGAARDLKHVLALDPTHPTAARELADIGGEHPSPQPFAAARRQGK